MRGRPMRLPLIPAWLRWPAALGERGRHQFSEGLCHYSSVNEESRLRIRRAVPTDGPAIARVHVDVSQVTYAAIIPAEHMATMTYERREAAWRQILAEPKQVTVVATVDGAITGFANGGDRRAGPAEYTGELYAIYLFPQNHRRGVGRALVRAVAEALADEGHRTIAIKQPVRGSVAAGGASMVTPDPVAGATTTRRHVVRPQNKKVANTDTPASDAAQPRSTGRRRATRPASWCLRASWGRIQIWAGHRSGERTSGSMPPEFGNRLAEVEMQKYDEAGLVRRLGRLMKAQRVAFAAACAERLLPSFDVVWRQGDEDAPSLRGILDRVWADASGESLPGADLEAQLHICMTLIPDEDDDKWGQGHQYVDDAASAVAYALCTIQSGGQAQEAAWAARRAYEAVDLFVTERLGIEDEEAVMRHPLTQAELTRQRQDLDELTAGGDSPDVLRTLRARAAADGVAMFTPTG
jgi:uncharacterized protein YjaG (DUF416 family)/GNAT superfamily N-acetyltransferase